MMFCADASTDEDDSGTVKNQSPETCDAPRVPDVKTKTTGKD